MKKFTESELLEAILAEKRAYAKKWRATNKERVKAINERYWRRKAEQKMSERENKNDETK